MMLTKIVFVVLGLIQLTVSDTPANCSYESTIGKWQIYTAQLALTCSTNQFSPSKVVTLIYPNTAIDEFGNYGRWTLIYNQGFEVIINNMKYFGFFDYKKINSTYAISYCDRLQPMWFHDVLIRQWKCFRAQKVGSVDNEKVFSVPKFNVLNLNTVSLNTLLYGSQKSLVDKINSENVGWIAEDYSEFQYKTLYELRNMAGGSKSRLKRTKPAPVTTKLLKSLKFIPQSFDWRNVNGINYVSPVRNQANCGSCYSFASAAMLEARYRIRSNNTITPILSPQDIVECSPYSQGCDGGFPYLIAGKYAEDFGMTLESCNPYKGQDGKCSTSKNCTRYFSTNYGYVGGFYGATNEPLMQMELVKNGPIVIGFEVYPDFMQYKGGVYHHIFSTHHLTTRKFGFNPFQLTNHAVLIVGYGQTNTGEKYWTVKNSWGLGWGENGYFRIRRGNDECGMESLAVFSEPIL